VISVIMPVCAWPNPADPDGDPHPELLKALSSLVTPELPAGAIELLIGTDGPCPKVCNAIHGWMTTHPEISTTIVECAKSSACTWGNRQRNVILDGRLAHGDLIVWQDQDDSFFPGALAGVTKVAAAFPGRPLIFKMQVCADRNGSMPFVLWNEKGRVERDHIGGHMLVVPNDPALLGRWEPEESYSSDFDFIESTLRKFAAEGLDPYWSELYISLLRPAAMRA
jgi:hypothetical protein